jgi:hypothetical protein
VADWHLRDLERRLVEHGWRVVNVLPGDRYRVSGTWEIARGAGETLSLDFEGLTEHGVALPIEKAYGCEVRGTLHGVGFGKRPGSGRPRGSWEQQAAGFVAGLEQLVTDSEPEPSSPYDPV